MRLLAVTRPAVLALSGCAAFSEDTAGSTTASRSRPPSTPSSTSPSGSPATTPTVVNLTQPGQEPHDLELTIKETADIAEADLVVYEKDFQPTVDDAIDQNATGATLDAAAVVGLEPRDHDGHDGHDEHDHGDLDPHFWQDPTQDGRARRRGGRAARRPRPRPRRRVRRQRSRPAQRPGVARRGVRRGPGRLRRDTVVVSHDAFGYLAEKYGLVMEPIAGLSPEAEPTPADLGRLQQLIDSAGVTTVFSERLASPKLADVAGRRPGHRHRGARPDRGTERRDRRRGLPFADAAEPRRPREGERLLMTPVRAQPTERSRSAAGRSCAASTSRSSPESSWP